MPVGLTDIIGSIARHSTIGLRHTYYIYYLRTRGPAGTRPIWDLRHLGPSALLVGTFVRTRRWYGAIKHSGERQTARPTGVVRQWYGLYPVGVG